MCYTYARATIGVSYAPTAYYADRLCERGRSYLRGYLSPEPASQHYKAYVATKTQITNQQAGVLALKLAGMPSPPKLPGRNASRKSAAQIQVEMKHEKDVEELVGQQIRNEAAQAFAQYRHSGPGPWSAKLDETMFWM
ncbi:hypothetical protein T440DRAFT_478259 [Plenodomus tracheiphilus IPT5]|uniref:Uncharacterized protein n=1 Tax=Plenodomus tracheiphilus IPT5 TaxID=1408161 RepID=A0A6A7B8Q5_9PLEO|nr:hypothetical protein T440DRAFT_478259 [Plenodomus tracheiphilus IPT5]